MDAQARALESDRTRLQRDRRAMDEAGAGLRDRERALAEREERFSRRLNEKLDDRVRQAQRDIDQVIAQLKDRSESLIEQVAVRQRTTGISTGDTGAARTEARDAIGRIVDQLKSGQASPSEAGKAPASAGASADVSPPVVGSRVVVGALGMEGVIVAIHGQQAEIDVRGKRLKARIKDLRVVSAPGKTAAAPAKIRVNVDLQPREGLLTELNVIGCTVDQAIDRVSKFLDETLVTDQQQIRIVHGHGTGQLRKGLAAYLKEHPLVAKHYAAPREQGGDGATIVELKE